jgi:hypothetical protein
MVSRLALAGTEPKALIGRTRGTTETKTETRRLRGGPQMWEPPRLLSVSRESETTL